MRRYCQGVRTLEMHRIETNRKETLDGMRFNQPAFFICLPAHDDEQKQEQPVATTVSHRSAGAEAAAICMHTWKYTYIQVLHSSTTCQICKHTIVQRKDVRIT